MHTHEKATSRRSPAQETEKNRTWNVKILPHLGRDKNFCIDEYVVRLIITKHVLCYKTLSTRVALIILLCTSLNTSSTDGCFTEHKQEITPH